jgi:sulfur carrier protein ThiS
MHRGSSKGAAGPSRRPGRLPLSASPPPAVRITFDIARGGTVTTREVEVPAGTLLRQALRRIGHAPEGSAVLDGDAPVPLDLPLRGPARFTLVPTFSGG